MERVPDWGCWPAIESPGAWDEDGGAGLYMSMLGPCCLPPSMCSVCRPACALSQGSQSWGSGKASADAGAGSEASCRTRAIRICACGIPEGASGQVHQLPWASWRLHALRACAGYVSAVRVYGLWNVFF